MLTADDIIGCSGQLLWWRCSINPSHEWRAALNNRVSHDSSCPWCCIVPRSKEELLLAFELLLFVPFDPGDHKLQVGAKLMDVDILLRNYKIAIEYDGSFWHRDKEPIDKQKAQTLERAGWKIIRVREEPLGAIGDCDVVVPLGKRKEAANRLISKVLTITGMPMGAFQKYRRRRRLQNGKTARTYIVRLLTEKGVVLHEGRRPHKQVLLKSIDER